MNDLERQALLRAGPVDLGDGQVIRRWVLALKLEPWELLEAVNMVGRDPTNVLAYLNTKRTPLADGAAFERKPLATSEDSDT